MMAAIYATLLIAFILDLLGHQRFAVRCLFISLALCVLLFLWEIYSPVYGFRMPWLQVEVAPPFGAVCGLGYERNQARCNSNRLGFERSVSFGHVVGSRRRSDNSDGPAIQFR